MAGLASVYRMLEALAEQAWPSPPSRLRRLRQGGAVRRPGARACAGGGRGAERLLGRRTRGRGAWRLRRLPQL